MIHRNSRLVMIWLHQTQNTNQSMHIYKGIYLCLCGDVNFDLVLLHKFQSLQTVFACHLLVIFHDIPQTRSILLCHFLDQNLEYWSIDVNVVCNVNINEWPPQAAVRSDNGIRDNISDTMLLIVNSPVNRYSNQGNFVVSINKVSIG